MIGVTNAERSFSARPKRPDTSRHAYLQATYKRGLLPEALDVCRVDESRIDIGGWSIGNEKAVALSEALALSPTLTELNVSNNRLRGSGARFAWRDRSRFAALCAAKNFFGNDDIFALFS